jgi:hypothetical protein
MATLSPLFGQAPHTLIVALELLSGMADASLRAGWLLFAVLIPVPNRWLHPSFDSERFSGVVPRCPLAFQEPTSMPFQSDDRAPTGGAGQLKRGKSFLLQASLHSMMDETDATVYAWSESR